MRAAGRAFDANFRRDSARLRGLREPNPYQGCALSFNNTSKLEPWRLPSIRITPTGTRDCDLGTGGISRRSHPRNSEQIGESLGHRGQGAHKPLVGSSNLPPATKAKKPDISGFFVAQGHFLQ